jgi:hypothetical protein
VKRISFGFRVNAPNISVPLMLLWSELSEKQEENAQGAKSIRAQLPCCISSVQHARQAAFDPSSGQAWSFYLLSDLLAGIFSAVPPRDGYGHDSNTRSTTKDGIQPHIIPGLAEYNQGHDDCDRPHDAIDHQNGEKVACR